VTAIGPVGHAVAANVERLRKARRMSLSDLSARLAEAGRPTGDTVLHRQAQGGRRIDADDLAAFAEVFGVSVTALLARSPGTAGAEDHPAVRAARQLADRLAAFLAAGDPETAACARVQAARAVRRAQLEAEELLDPAAGGTHDRRNIMAGGTS